MKYGFILIGIVTALFCSICIGTIKMSHSYLNQPSSDYYGYNQASTPSPCAHNEYYICKDEINGKDCRCE